MDGCDQCKARWIARLIKRARDEQLQRLPRLREQAIAEHRADLRELRRINGAEQDVDQVRAPEHVG